ncbi:hypothetical protein Ptr902_02560 [Pyrenophora tritici-repentis]|nr:hypothetical protein Ptr902_02560 [Pyrenophora tritici-repentis]
MRSPSKSRNEKDTITKIQEPQAIPHNCMSMEKTRKETTTPLFLLPPAPTRNPSTRILEPTRAPSTQARKHDYPINRGNSTTSKPTANAQPQRPALSRRRTTARTRYIDMLLGLDSVPPLHNILASLSVWILLAGYIVFPATFTALRRSENTSSSSTSSSHLKAAALSTVRNIPLLYVAAFACGIGVCGCLYLWYAHRKNYVWVINRIFLPALLNSIAGLISTIVNIYSAQEGQYSVTARVTIVVTAACSVVAAGLFLVYNTVMLRLVKRRHDREVEAVEKEAGRRDGVDEA